MPILFCLFCSSKAHLQTFAHSLLTSLEKGSPCAISLVDVLPALSLPVQSPFPHTPCPCCQPGMSSLVTDQPRPGYPHGAGALPGQWGEGGPGRSTPGWGSGWLPAPAVPWHSGDRGSSLVKSRGVDGGRQHSKGWEGNLLLTKKFFVVK